MSIEQNRTLIEVWNKARSINGYDPDIWRQDFAGAWIRRDAYGSHTQYGWEIDHIRPISKGGSNDIKNLTVLHWKNNLRKSADYPEFHTMITSEGNENIIKEKKWKIQSNP